MSVSRKCDFQAENPRVVGSIPTHPNDVCPFLEMSQICGRHCFAVCYANMRASAVASQAEAVPLNDDLISHVISSICPLSSLFGGKLVGVSRILSTFHHQYHLTCLWNERLSPLSRGNKPAIGRSAVASRPESRDRQSRAAVRREVCPRTAGWRQCAAGTTQ